MKATTEAAVGIYVYVLGDSRDLTWSEVAKEGLPENMAFELRAEGPARVHGMNARLGERHVLRRGNRM